MTTTDIKSGVAAELARFVEVKRALGRKYATDERVLRGFDRFLLRERVSDVRDITADHVRAFLSTRTDLAPRGFNSKLAPVRRFLNWLVAQGVLETVPLDVRPRRVTRQRIPFLFDVTLAKRLLRDAAALPDNPTGRRRGVVYHTLFAMLYGLGMRVGEACHLRCDDVDAARRLLVVRGAKFGKTRLVPFGPRIAALLDAQLAHRRRETPDTDAPLFTFDGIHCIQPKTVSMVFLAMTRAMKLTIPEGTATPHLHDLRHSFAVGSLLRWYREGADASARMIYLATFMGHADPTSTEVYLTITSDLLHEANRRFEAFVGDGAELPL